MSEDRSAKRSAAQERLKGSFLAQVGPHLRELGDLLDSEGEDCADTVVAELERIGRTAGALGLAEVAEAASEAGTRLAAGEDLIPVACLEPVARVVRHARPRPRFAPIGVIGDGALIAEFEKVRDTTAEPLKLGTRLGQIADALASEPWAALLVPVQTVEKARAIADGAPVLAWGETRNWDARLEAVAAGADGFVSRQDSVGALLERVRATVDRSLQPGEIFVIAEDNEARAGWMEALQEAGFGAVASNQPSEIAPALDVVCPDVLLIAGSVAGVGAATLVQATRSHGARSHVPVVVVGDKLDESSLRYLGADDVLPGDTSTDEILERVKQRYERSVAIRRGRHPVSDLRDRPGILRSLGHRMAHVVRTSEPLSISIMQLDGIESARERWGKAAANAAQRIAARQLREGLRQIDVVGQLGDDAFLAALHGCPERIARRRMSDIARKIELKLHGDHRLREVICLFGVADTDRGGLGGVVLRADEDLMAVGRSTQA